MLGFRKCKEFLLKLTSSLPDPLQNQNLEIIQACIVVLCFPHSNVVRTFDFRKCKEFLLKLTSSLQGLLQNQNVENIILICIVVLCFPHAMLFEFTCVMNVRDQTRQAFVTRFCHFVTARASLFTDHKISSLPISAKYEHFRTICEQTADNSPTDPFFLL